MNLLAQLALFHPFQYLDRIQIPLYRFISTFADEFAVSHLQYLDMRKISYEV